MKHYFQHPKRANGTLNTSTGPIQFTTDEFGRDGILTIPHEDKNLSDIETFQKLGLKDIGEPSTAEKQAAQGAKKAETGTITFRHPHELNVTLKTSAGEIKFTSGLATVSGKQADVLIAQKFEQVGAQDSAQTPGTDQSQTIIVPTLEDYIAVGKQADTYERAFPGFKAGDKITEKELSDAQEKFRKEEEDNKKALTPKQLKAIAKKNDIETDGKTDEEIHTILKDKNLLP